MEKLIQFLEGLAFVIYLLGLFYIVSEYNRFAVMYGIEPHFLLGILFIGVLYIGYRYLRLSIRANKLEYEFTSIVNHTFRTPLTRIMWLTKEMEKEMNQKDRLLYLQNTANATTKLLEIVDLFVGIKTINNTSSYYFEAISIRETVERAMQKYREEINRKNLTFTVASFRDIPLITIDIKKISFVVDTVLENAILYSDKDGKIDIRCEHDKHGMTLSIKDEGMGIPFMTGWRIFHRFYRSKQAVLKNPDGMGLKLYLSKQIVKKHKGKIYCTSRGKNKGATFYIRLPFTK